MKDEDEYPEGARFGWDLIRMSPEEIDEMCDALDAGDEEQADAVVDRAAERVFGAHSN